MRTVRARKLDGRRPGHTTHSSRQSATSDRAPRHEVSFEGRRLGGSDRHLPADQTTHGIHGTRISLPFVPRVVVSGSSPPRLASLSHLQWIFRKQHCELPHMGYRPGPQ